jgi:isochorismate synthase
MQHQVSVDLHSLASEAVQDLLGSPAFAAFASDLHARVTAQQQPHIATICFRIAGLDALAVAEWLQRPHDFQYFFERPNDQFGIAAGGVLCEHVSTDNGDRFNEADTWFKTWQQKNAVFFEHPHSLHGLLALGGFSFTGHDVSDEWSDFQKGRIAIPKWVYIRDGKNGIVIINRLFNPDDSPQDLFDYFSERAATFAERIRQPEERPYPGPNRFTTSGDSATDQERWMEQVSRALATIHSGKLEKVVLARPVFLTASNSFDALAAANFLREQYPSNVTFMISFNGNGTFIGCSPETLVSTWSDILRTEAVAGSIARGRTAGDDARNEQRLLQSSKDRYEHHLVLQQIVRQLLPLARTLEYAPSPEIRKLANVQHLVTPVQAVLHEAQSAITVTGRLHPTPAVCGTPTTAAAGVISDIETFNRGWYASPVGWMCSTGRAEFSVAIRSALVRGNFARLFAGCGIVSGSDPAQEWEETRIKLQPMLQALTHDNG